MREQWTPLEDNEKEKIGKIRVAPQEGEIPAEEVVKGILEREEKEKKKKERWERVPLMVRKVVDAAKNTFSSKEQEEMNLEPSKMTVDDVVRLNEQIGEKREKENKPGLAANLKMFVSKARETVSVKSIAKGAVSVAGGFVASATGAKALFSWKDYNDAKKDEEFYKYLPKDVQRFIIADKMQLAGIKKEEVYAKVANKASAEQLQEARKIIETRLENRQRAAKEALERFESLNEEAQKKKRVAIKDSIESALVAGGVGLSAATGGFAAGAIKGTLAGMTALSKGRVANRLFWSAVEVVKEGEKENLSRMQSLKKGISETFKDAFGKGEKGFMKRVGAGAKIASPVVTGILAYCGFENDIKKAAEFWDESEKIERAIGGKVEDLSASFEGVKSFSDGKFEELKAIIDDKSESLKVGLEEAEKNIKEQLTMLGETVDEAQKSALEGFEKAGEWIKEKADFAKIGFEEMGSGVVNRVRELVDDIADHLGVVGEQSEALDESIKEAEVAVEEEYLSFGEAVRQTQDAMKKDFDSLVEQAKELKDSIGQRIETFSLEEEIENAKKAIADAMVSPLNEGEEEELRKMMEEITAQKEVELQPAPLGVEGGGVSPEEVATGKVEVQPMRVVEPEKPLVEVVAEAQEALEKKIIPVEVKASSRGAIQTFIDLRAQLRETYAGVSEDQMPGIVKKLLTTEGGATALAKEYGFYNPGAQQESFFMKAGETINIAEDGNLEYVLKDGSSKLLARGDDWEKAESIIAKEEMRARMVSTEPLEEVAPEEIELRKRVAKVDEIFNKLGESWAQEGIDPVIGIESRERIASAILGMSDKSDFLGVIKEVEGETPEGVAAVLNFPERGVNLEIHEDGLYAFPEGMERDVAFKTDRVVIGSFRTIPPDLGAAKEALYLAFRTQI